MTETDHTDTIIYAPARIVTTQTRGAPTDDDLALINERFAHEPLTADDVFTFTLVASTDAVDTHSTRMDVATSLRNFAQDFTDGQSVLDSHVISRLPIGGTYRGVLQSIESGRAEGEPATSQVLVSAYLQRSLSEQYRTGILGGTYRRCSVGFLGSDLRFVCDIDGKDLWDSDYYPGQRLKDGRRVTFRVVNARAMEVSLVFRNSTPGALVSRMQDLITTRHIPPCDVAALESAWQTRFITPSPLYRGAPIRTQGDPMEPKDFIHAVLDQATVRAGTRAALERADTMEAVAAVVRTLVATDAAAETQRALVQALGENATVETVRALQAEAEAGRAYRKVVIDDAVQARVAVAGNDFDADAYRTRLEKRDLADLEDERSAWQNQRAATFAPGRVVGGGRLPARGEGGQIVGGVVENAE